MAELGDTAVVVLAAISAVSSVVAFVALRYVIRGAAPCPCERLAADIEAVRAKVREVAEAVETAGRGP